jgi:hypothetical protein
MTVFSARLLNVATASALALAGCGETTSHWPPETTNGLYTAGRATLIEAADQKTLYDRTALAKEALVPLEMIGVVVDFVATSELKNKLSDADRERACRMTVAYAAAALSADRTASFHLNNILINACGEDIKDNELREAYSTLRTYAPQGRPDYRYNISGIAVKFTGNGIDEKKKSANDFIKKINTFTSVISAKKLNKYASISRDFFKEEAENSVKLIKLQIDRPIEDEIYIDMYDLLTQASAISMDAKDQNVSRDVEEFIHAMLDIISNNEIISYAAKSGDDCNNNEKAKEKYCGLKGGIKLENDINKVIKEYTKNFNTIKINKFFIDELSSIEKSPDSQKKKDVSLFPQHKSFEKTIRNYRESAIKGYHNEKFVVSIVIAIDLKESKDEVKELIDEMLNYKNIYINIYDTTGDEIINKKYKGNERVRYENVKSGNNETRIEDLISENNHISLDADYYLLFWVGHGDRNDELLIGNNTYIKYEKIFQSIRNMPEKLRHAMVVINACTSGRAAHVYYGNASKNNKFNGPITMITAESNGYKLVSATESMTKAVTQFFRNIRNEKVASDQMSLFRHLQSRYDYNLNQFVKEKNKNNFYKVMIRSKPAIFTLRDNFRFNNDVFPFYYLNETNHSSHGNGSP